MRRYLGRSVVFIAVVLFYSCDSFDSGKLFTLMPSRSTGVTFANNLTYTERINPYSYHNFYNGGGVAAGDINNDGLQDLFFCSNQGNNKLYLNKGNFTFEDISERAGILSEGLWSTGVTFADVNGDGLLDIYVCRAADFLVGWRGNQLYINQGDLTFREKAESYRLASSGFSTHAAFFDYDNDGDLDCYLLSNSNRSGPDYYEIRDQRTRVDKAGGNRIYRNDGAQFTDVTAESGIFGSIVGFGLGVAVADINKDGWQDVYVSNDFFEKDYLYINRGNGTFEESLEKYIGEISMFSMGADIADINNDGYPEIYVTDMLPEEETRIKSKTRFETWERYQSNLKNGYYQQFLRNVFQLNCGPIYRNGDSAEFHFSEVSRFAGVAATDWSWGALIADLDNDGFKDLFVSNGMYKDVTDQDFIQFIANSFEAEKAAKKERASMKELIDLIPSGRVSNYAFSNNGDLTFTNRTKEWGLDKHFFSNGSAYVDLDNDGDLDLVTNNVNSEASLYRNNAAEMLPANKYLKVNLHGEGKNPFGVGAKVTLYYDSTLSYMEVAPARGFQSSVDNRLNFGLGNTDKIDSLVVEWTGGKIQRLTNIPTNQTLIVLQKDASIQIDAAVAQRSMVIFPTPHDDYGIDFVHRENDYVDFNSEKLVFYMHSAEGPRLAKADVNGDGRDDIFIGGGKNQSGELFVQTTSGRFSRSHQPAFQTDKGSEDSECLFFDANGDTHSDLFVCSGTGEFPADKVSLADRLYINDGKGNFTRSATTFPSEVNGASSSVAAADYDGDGDADLFVGTRLIPGSYGLPCRGTIWQNNGKGMFSDVTASLAPGLLNAGMITDGEWIDYDHDGKIDLAVAGEYMPIRLFHNEGNGFKEMTSEAGLGKSNGWWNRLAVCDVNGDGYPDLVAGNHGLNSRFKATTEKPVSMYVSDFDDNGTIEQIVCTYNGNIQYPMVLRHDLVGLLPSLKKKYLKYEDYKGKTMNDIFTKEQMSKATRLDAYSLQTSLFINNKKGGFTVSPLPLEAQLSPVFGIVVADFDGDGNQDILLGGNYYHAKPEVGINDASYGVLLKGDGKGRFQSVAMSKSNLLIKGAVRDMVLLRRNGKRVVLISRNNGRAEVLEIGER